MLTTAKEKAICEKYSAYDENDRVRCDKCPLIIGNPAQHDFDVKRTAITMKR